MSRYTCTLIKSAAIADSYTDDYYTNVLVLPSEMEMSRHEQLHVLHQLNEVREKCRRSEMHNVVLHNDFVANPELYPCLLPLLAQLKQKLQSTMKVQLYDRNREELQDGKTCPQWLWFFWRDGMPIPKQKTA